MKRLLALIAAVCLMCACSFAQGSWRGDDHLIFGHNGDAGIQRVGRGSLRVTNGGDPGVNQTLGTLYVDGLIPSAYTVATLPSGPTIGSIYIVTDSLTSGACDTGGGTSDAICRWNGASYDSIGGGGGASPAGATNELQNNNGLNQLGATGVFATGGNVLASGSITVGPGQPADSTVTAGGSVVWDATNHRWTAASTQRFVWPVVSRVANTANGTGTRADGLPACGGSGTGGGTNFCVYIPGDSTVISIASGTEGNAVVINTSGGFADAGGLASSVASGVVSGVLTSAVSGGLATMQTLVGFRASFDHGYEFTIDGAGSVITTGDIKLYGTATTAGTIDRIDISADQSCSVTIDIWKRAGAIPTVANKISASAPLTLSSAQLAQNGSISGWTTAVAVGDVFDANVASVTGCTRVTGKVHYQ
jgi:hypothetical protein